MDFGDRKDSQEEDCRSVTALGAVGLKMDAYSKKMKVPVDVMLMVGRCIVQHQY